MTEVSRRGPEGRREAAGCVVALCSFLLLAGCGSSSYEDQILWVQANPRAPDSVKKAVLKKRIIEGMDKGAVIVSWGEPREKTVIDKGMGRWRYLRPTVINGRRVRIEYILIFKDGILIGHHQQILR